MVSYRCPSCWGAVAPAAAVCPGCLADLAMLDCEPYESKLIRALRHPEPLTRRRAVRILGERRVGEAIPALLLCASNGADPYLRAEVVLALQQIGTSSAASALARLAADPSVIVQQALRGDRAPPRGPRTHRS